MTFKLTVNHTFTLDMDDELERIDNCFKGRVRSRQLALIQAVIDEGGVSETVIQMYHELPYNQESDCSEREFIGEWYAKIYSLNYAGGGKVDSLELIVED